MVFGHIRSSRQQARRSSTGLTNAEIEATAGGAGQTIAHDSRRYPAANRQLTWQASLPSHIGAVDRGRALTASGGGFWVTTDIVGGISASSRIDIGWYEFSHGADFKPVHDQIITDYTDVYLKCPLLGGELFIDDADYTAGTVDRYDIANAGDLSTFTLKPKRWIFSENLTGLTWTNTQASSQTNEWSASLAAEPTMVFVKVSGNGNSNGNAPKDNYLADTGAKLAVASWSGSTRYDWDYDTGSNLLRIYSPDGNPSTAFLEIRTLSEYPDRIMRLPTSGTEFFYLPSKMRVEGGNPTGFHPMGRTNSSRTSHNGNNFYCVEVDAGEWTPPKGDYGIRCSTQNIIGSPAIRINGATTAGRGIALVTNNGVHHNAGISGGDIITLYEEGYEQYESYGDNAGWAGNLSHLAVDQRNRNLSNFYYSRASSGDPGSPTVRGVAVNGALIFANSEQHGNGPSDPYIVKVRNSMYSLPDESPNNRPVKITLLNSSDNELGNKTDPIGNKVGKFNVRFVFENILDENGNVPNVDISSLVGNNNVLADPTTVQLYAGAGYTYETTGELIDRAYVSRTGQDATEFQGNVQAPFRLWLTEERDYGAVGYECGVKGVANQDNGVDLTGLPPYSNVKNMNQVAVFGITPGISESDYHHIVAGGGTYSDGPNATGKIRFGNNSRGATISSYEFTGTARKIIEADLHPVTVDTSPSQYRAGDITITTITSLTAPTNSTIDVADSVNQDRDDFWISVDGTWYNAPYIVGGSNTTRSGSPNLLKRTAYGHYPIGDDASTNTNSVVMPPAFNVGDAAIVALFWQGDPGTVTQVGETGDLWTHVAGGDINNGTVYGKLYKKVTTANTWGPDGGGKENREFEVTWTTDRAGWAVPIVYENAHSDIVGQVATLSEASGATATGSQLTGVLSDSIVLQLTCIEGDRHVSGFDSSGSDGAWTRVCSRQSADTYGWSLQASSGQIRNWDWTNGPSFAAAQIYAPGSTVAGCDMPLIGGNAAAIHINVEIKSA